MLLPCSVPIDARTGQVQILAAAPGQIRNKAPPRSYDQPVALVAAKLALSEAMRAQQISRTELARRLGLRRTRSAASSTSTTARIYIDQIARAVAALGKGLGVQVLESASPLTGNPRSQSSA